MCSMISASLVRGVILYCLGGQIWPAGQSLTTMRWEGREGALDVCRTSMRSDFVCFVNFQKAHVACEVKAIMRLISPPCTVRNPRTHEGALMGAFFCFM